MVLDSSAQWWADVASSIQSCADALTREEAQEVYAAEAARIRLCDRRGICSVTLACGVTMVGDVVQPEVAGAVTMIDERGRRILVSLHAVRMARPREGRALRDESRGDLPSMRSVLRSAEPVQVLVSGHWLAGHVLMACADHVVLDSDGDVICVPYGAAEAWILESVLSR